MLKTHTSAHSSRIEQNDTNNKYVTGCRTHEYTQAVRQKFIVHWLTYWPAAKLFFSTSAVAGSTIAGSAIVGTAAASFSGAGSAAASSSGAGTDGATSTASRLLFSRLPSEVSSSPAVVVKKISGFYSCRPPHCQVDASSLVFCSTGGIQARMFINQYSLRYFLIITDYLKKSE